MREGAEETEGSDLRRSSTPLFSGRKKTGAVQAGGNRRAAIGGGDGRVSKDEAGKAENAFG